MAAYQAAYAGEKSALANAQQIIKRARAATPAASIGVSAASAARRGSISRVACNDVCHGRSKMTSSGSSASWHRGISTAGSMAACHG